MDQTIRKAIYKVFPPETNIVRSADMYIVTHPKAVREDGAELHLPIIFSLLGADNPEALCDVYAENAFKQFRRTLDEKGLKIEGITMSEVE